MYAPERKAPWPCDVSAAVNRREHFSDGGDVKSNIVQPQQTYDVTVTGTSGTLAHSATIKLTVE
jgi:hypothetical protein